MLEPHLRCGVLVEARILQSYVGEDMGRVEAAVQSFFPRQEWRHSGPPLGVPGDSGDVTVGFSK